MELQDEEQRPTDVVYSSSANVCIGDVCGCGSLVSVGRSGGLRLLWTDEVQVSIEFSSRYLILSVCCSDCFQLAFCPGFCEWGSHQHIRSKIFGTILQLLCMMI